jgi:AcrR family transcriptional regulator
MKVRRPYRMLARADAAAATRARILQAATAMVWEQPDMTLDEVATRAGVSVQTVIRAFGGRAALIDAAAQAARAEIEAERSSALPGNVAASVRVLFDHYERIGDPVVAMLGMERRLTRAAEMVAAGRRMHRRWVRTQFAPQITRQPQSDREAIVDALVAVCDVYIWKLFRRDLGLDRDAAEERVRRMVAAIVRGGF